MHGVKERTMKRADGKQKRRNLAEVRCLSSLGNKNANERKAAGIKLGPTKLIRTQNTFWMGSSTR
jgi:hypothetical protein